VFVTTGAGFRGPPVRLFNAPEVVVLTAAVDLAARLPS
jgi:predicted MPP superfamily phosphohydrolase